MTSVLKDRPTPQNPLGIIALFVFFIEAIATVSLGLVSGQPYAIHLVWFIILYPTFIAGAFFLLLWIKREALYSPADFRDDSTFRDILLRKVEIIEAKQDAANIDASTNLDDVKRTIERLIQLGDIYAAINVGRAYLREGEYDKSVILLEYLRAKIRITDGTYYKVLANLGYALIGLGKYREAVTQLEQVRAIDDGKHFLAWHSLALAYAHYRLGEQDKYQRWLKFSRDAEGFRGNEHFFSTLYPEIKDDLR
jgi:tetratricopeptide (TPR) repeat protein